MNETNATLLPREGVAELGSVLEIATLLPIRFVMSALRKGVHANRGDTSHQASIPRRNTRQRELEGPLQHVSCKDSC